MTGIKSASARNRVLHVFVVTVLMTESQKIWKGTLQSMRNRFFIRLVYPIAFITLTWLLVSCSIFNPVLPDGMSIAGVPVGGLNKEEAISVVSEIAVQTYATRSMGIQIGDKTFSISPSESNVQLDVTAAVKAAFSNKDISGALDISPYLSIQEDNIRNFLKEIQQTYFSSEFSESSYELIGQQPSLDSLPEDGEGQTLVLNIGTPGISLDVEELFQKILYCYQTGTFQFVFDPSVVLPSPLNIEEICNKVHINPVNAVMDMKTFEISPHSYGYTFDLQEVQSAVNSAGFGQVLEFPLVAVEPEVTSQELSSLLYRDVLSSHTARASSQWGRDINLKLSCQAINGIILFPGEVFSYNPALGERTPDRGWEKADGYVGMETVSEYGGGICQASSCLYLCAMLADMEIVERVNHGFISSYMPYGMDATVSWGGPEFKFKNNSDYPIRIEAYASGGTVTVSLIGTDTKDYYVKMEYEILQTDPFETVEQEFPPDNPDGYKDGDVVITPYTGYKIATFRCKYHKESKELLSREREAVSSYSRRDKVVCKIVQPEATVPAVEETAPPEVP